MKDQNMTKKQLINKLMEFHQKISELEALENERKRAEETLRESEHKLRTILQGSPIPAFVIGKDHKVMYWNKALEEMSGIKAEEIMGTNQHWKAFYSEKRPCMADLLVDGEIDGITQWYEGKYTKSKLIEGAYEATDFFPALGEEGRWLRFTAAIIRDSMGYLIGALETFEDITGRKKVEEKIAKLNCLKEQLLGMSSLNEKLKLITDAVVEIFGADFARVWMTKEGDLCEKDCRHATVMEDPHVCRDRTSCLHLMVSSGRYTGIDGSHRRVPLGCYKIGRVASGEDSKFITNDVTGDPRVHDHEWARTLGLVSFAGFRLLSAEGKPIGVLALFSKLAVVPNEERFLEDLANTTSHVILAGMVEEALRESEEKYRNLVERANDGIIIVQDGIIKFANMRSAEMGGEIIEEVIGTPFTDYIYPDELPQIVDRYKRRMAGENVTPIYETIIRRKDGIKVYAEVNGGLITYQGKPADLVIVRDITERKRAEEALRESEEKYRTILESIEDGYYEVDLAGNFTFFNDSLCRLSGYSKEELMGMNDRQYTDPENAKKLYQEFNKIYRTGESGKVFDWEIIKKDGTKRNVEASVCLIKDSREQPIGFRGIVRDITEHKQAEEAFRNSEERYRSLVANTTDMIFIAQDEIAKFPNPASLTLTGYSDEELATIPFTQFIHPEDREMVRDRYIRRLNGEEVSNIYSFRILNKKGEELWVQLNAVLITWDRRPAVLCFLRDITVQKRLEAQYLHAQKMEAVGILAGGIAHDFNNLLMAIQGNASLILLDVDSGHPFYEMLKNIEQYVQSGADLTGQLLGFARRGKYETKITDLNKLIKKSSEMFGRTKKQIIIHSKYKE